jgi:hypothetical protein
MRGIEPREFEESIPSSFEEVYEGAGPFVKQSA